MRRVLIGILAVWMAALPVWAQVYNVGPAAEGHQIVTVASGSCPYTVTAADATVLINAASGACTVTLPAVASSPGRVLRIKKTDSSVNAVTVDGSGSETLDGATTVLLLQQYDEVTLQADATEWRVLGEKRGCLFSNGSDFDRTTTTLAAVTGLDTCVVAAGKKYQFRAVLHTTITSGGQQFDLNGTATATAVIAQWLCTKTDGTITLGSRKTALASAASETAAGAHDAHRKPASSS